MYLGKMTPYAQDINLILSKLISLSVIGLEEIMRITYCGVQGAIFLPNENSSRKRDLHTLLPCCFPMLLTDDMMLRLWSLLTNMENSQPTEQNAWKGLSVPLKHPLWHSLLLEFLIKENRWVLAKIIQIFSKLNILTESYA